MTTVPYLNFDGRCAEAFRFYAEVLGGTLDLMSHGDSPVAAEIPDAWHDRIMHAHLVAGDAVLMGSDFPPEHTVPVQGMHVSLHVDDAEQAHRVFQALAGGGEVTMPLAKTFWAEKFGMLIDRFGIRWMVNFAGAAAEAPAS
jgi:PhnB protein